MSALRDVRLLIARHLDLPQNVRAGILDVLNLLDADLDVQGYEDSSGAVTDALARLDRMILGDEDDIEDDVEDELFDTRVSLTDLVQRISTGDDDDDEDDED